MLNRMLNLPLTTTNISAKTSTHMKPKILITGGSGYIGSHTCIELLQAGFDLVVVDNLCNSKQAALVRVEAISGQRINFYHADVRDREKLQRIFQEHAIQAVIHFAGLKAVGESVERPLEYYDANVNGTLVLLDVMAAMGVKNLVFSSSATVYGEPPVVCIKEDFPLMPESPYARSKLMIEQVLRDLYRADSRWRIALLRYFNPVGAHASGMIGEDPNGVPNNLMPIVAQVAVGKRATLSIYGNDYATPDGTGIRDYIHVVDLAIGHLKALTALPQCDGVMTLNLGAGRGYSVLEVVRAFEAASGRPVPYQFVPRRAGDIAEYFSDPSRAESLLGWRATRGLEQMCIDTWRWQSANPAGYGVDKR